ncbi:MAG: hypothetical protein M5U28_21360 [Sandaracinaceae bacterium]|nr:hypothetical protein [Sandaracinaceae bacterium]
MLLGALAVLSAVGCGDSIDLGAVGLAEEAQRPPVDYRAVLHQGQGSPGTELGRVTPVLDALLEHAARAPGSRVRVFALAEDGPPVALLDETSPALPRRPRARDRHVDRYVAEHRARVLERYTPLIDAGLRRAEIADAVDRVARLDPVPGADDIELVVVSDLRESSALGRFGRRATLPTTRQVLRRATIRRLFEPASFVGVRVSVVHALLPGRRLDSSAAHEARVRERWEALFQRAGAADVTFTSGPRASIQRSPRKRRSEP